MSIAPQQNRTFAVKKGDMVISRGEKVLSLNLLLQGKIDIFIAPSTEKSIKTNEDILNRSYKLFDIDNNIFIGANDIFLSGNHALSYRASEDCSLYSLYLQNQDEVWSLVNSQKDYGAYIINSLCTLIGNANSSIEKLNLRKHSLKTVVQNLNVYFWNLKEKYGFDYTPSAGFFSEGRDKLREMRENGITLTHVFNRQFIEKNHLAAVEEGTSETSANKMKTDYYAHLYNLPAELRKGFFGADMFITSYHCRDASSCLNEILNLISGTFSEMEEYFGQLYFEGRECIYSALVKAAEGIEICGLDVSPVLQALDNVFTVIIETIAVYENEYLHKCETDINYLEHSHNNIKASFQTGLSFNASVKTECSTGSNPENIPEELKNSTRRILEYADIPEDRANSFLMNLMAFRNLRDKLSTDDAARSIRSTVASGFFEIYESVFKKVYEQKNNSRLFNMFLTYGYMDEKLLTAEQTLTIYRLAGKNGTSGQNSVYNMKEWLSKIYEMEKDPSINEFGQDYLDAFREMKKHGKITDKDKPLYDNNRDGRLAFETANMLKTNHKLCHGQINVYMPVLYSDMITRDLANAVVTPEMINEGIKRILDVDFSAFHREIHFRDSAKGIEKEIIMKSIIPDFILIPIFGTRSIMWQEISGRNRSTPGRLLIPVFTDENLDDLLIKLAGNFRWELCRTMMGSAWNDVTQSSLTSEYSDYIQFYKKNKDLSEDAKDKIKAQIQKYHNRTRDIFTSDYELWINNEAKGNVRLNKVARNILYKHCPFIKPIREQLEKQPLYTETAVQFKIQRTKLARELENRYGKYIKTIGSLDPDLEQNLTFYRDL